MKKALGIATSVVASLTVMTLSATPASATVHEIVGQACSGQGDLFPAGLTGGSSADNFAQPLFSTGVIESVSVVGDDTFIDLDFSHPAIKLVSGGAGYVPVAPNTFVTAFALDPKFMKCNEFRS